MKFNYLLKLLILESVLSPKNRNKIFIHTMGQKRPIVIQQSSLIVYKVAEDR
jgi:rRNA pseudouridine-1189 N-methylase Emg1 (Nep1/Mra1 family)